jgi:hypothetical protein
MIINTAKVKSEALLLFCRDLIESYQTNTLNQYGISDDTVKYIDAQIIDILKAINILVQPIDYYVRNQRVSRIAMILKSYQFVNQKISKEISKGESFNPSMLCFSLLCSWFTELGATQDDKEYIYFTLYPYGEVYDTLLLKNSNIEYKKLNMKMLTIAEKTIINLHKYRFQ